MIKRFPFKTICTRCPTQLSEIVRHPTALKGGACNLRPRQQPLKLCKHLLAWLEKISSCKKIFYDADYSVKVHERVESVWTDWFVENVCFNQSENLLLLYSPSLRQPIENSVNNWVSFAIETTENLWTFRFSDLNILVRLKSKFVCVLFYPICPKRVEKTWLLPIRSL